MTVFTGYYERKTRTEINFNIYRDDNGVWMHILSKRDKLVYDDFRVELDDDTASMMGKLLMDCSNLRGPGTSC